MIYRHLLISLIFVYSALNISFARRVSQVIDLSFPSHDIINLSTQQKIINRRDTTKGTFSKKETCNKNGQTYCENAPDYPAEEIRRLLEIQKINITTFNTNIYSNITSSIDLANRIDVRNERPLCYSKAGSRKPNKGETEEGDWLFIVEGQDIMVDECTSQNQPCDMISGIQTICEQQYLIRKLYAYDEKRVVKEIRKMKFKIPSCCMCKVINPPGMSTSPRHQRKTARHVVKKRNQDAFLDHPTKSKYQFSSFTSRRDSNNIKCSEQFTSTLCIKAENYPKDIIKNLQRQGAFNNSPLFGIDDENVAVSTRSDMEKAPMCDSQSILRFPDAAVNVEGVWKWVVQDIESGFRQGILTEECIQTGATCNFTGSLPLNYVPTCQQMYVQRQLVMVDPQTSKPGTEIGLIPSCCACHVRFS